MGTAREAGTVPLAKGQREGQGTQVRGAPTVEAAVVDWPECASSGECMIGLGGANDSSM